MGTVPVLVWVLFTNADRTVLMYVYAMSTVQVLHEYWYSYSYEYSEACARANHTSTVEVRYRTYLYAHDVSISRSACGPVRLFSA